MSKLTYHMGREMVKLSHSTMATSVGAGMGAGGLAGAGLGGLFGAGMGLTGDNTNKDGSKQSRLLNALRGGLKGVVGGGLVGAAGGGALGAALDNDGAGDLIRNTLVESFGQDSGGPIAIDHFKPMARQPLVGANMHQVR